MLKILFFPKIIKNQNIFNSWTELVATIILKVLNKFDQDLQPTYWEEDDLVFSALYFQCYKKFNLVVKLSKIFQNHEKFPMIVAHWRSL